MRSPDQLAPEGLLPLPAPELRRAARIGPLAGAWALLLLVLLDVLYRLSDGTLDAGGFFTSDHLYLPALYRDVIEEGGRWLGWRLSPAPYFFPDMALYFALDALCGSFVRASLAYAALQVVALVFAVEFLRRAAGGGRADTGPVTSVLVVVALLLAYATGHFPLVRFALFPGFHFSVVVLGLVALGLALLAFEGRARGAVGWLAAVCLLMTASDGLFLVAFTLPAGIALLALAWLQRPAGAQRLRVVLGAMGVATSAGFWIGRWMSHRSNAGYLRPRPREALDSLIRLLGAGAEQVGTFPAVAFTWIALVLGAVFVLAARRSHAPSTCGERGLHAVCLYGVLALATSASALVAMGLFHRDAETSRYVALPVLLPFLALPLALGPRARANWSGSAAVLSLLALGCGGALLGHRWPAQRPAVLDLYPPLVECLDRNQARYGLRRGVSEYWNAKFISMFSRSGLRVNQLLPDGQVYSWNNNSDWYLEPRVAYDFAVTDGLDVDAFRLRFGEPRARFFCPHREGPDRADVEIDVYGEGFDAALRESLAADLLNPSTARSSPRSAMP